MEKTTVPPQEQRSAYNQVVWLSNERDADDFASGLPTFRGAGGMWKNYEATLLAIPPSFGHDPGLVWQIYSYMALKAKPNLAHYALAELARRKENFWILS